MFFFGAYTFLKDISPQYLAHSWIWFIKIDYILYVHFYKAITTRTHFLVGYFREAWGDIYTK